MSKKLIGIYCILNTINNKRYYGSSINIKRRLIRHKYELKSGIHNNSYLQRSVNKYGIDAFIFSIVETFDTKISDSELRLKEDSYCVKYNTHNEACGYNIIKELGDSREMSIATKTKLRDGVIAVKGHPALIVNIVTLQITRFKCLSDAFKYLGVVSQARFYKKLIVDGNLHIFENEFNKIPDIKRFIENKQISIYHNNLHPTALPVFDPLTGVYYTSTREFLELNGNVGVKRYNQVIILSNQL